MYLLPCLLSACASDNSDKYRDIKSLELPPTLAIEHNANNTGATTDTPSTNKSKANTVSEPVRDKSSGSELNKLILLVGDESKPTLQLKTRFERAWDLVFHGLHLAEIEVIEQNKETGVIKVRYVADGNSKGRGIISSINSFISDKFEDTEYTLTLDKDKKATDVHIKKVVADEDNPSAFNNDDSSSLTKLLHKTIIADLEK